MSEKLPTNEEEMLEIDNVTSTIFNKFGKGFLEITKEYADKKLGNICLNCIILRKKSCKF